MRPIPALVQAGTGQQNESGQPPPLPSIHFLVFECRPQNSQMKRAAKGSRGKSNHFKGRICFLDVQYSIPLVDLHPMFFIHLQELMHFCARSCLVMLSQQRPELLPACHQDAPPAVLSEKCLRKPSPLHTSQEVYCNCHRGTAPCAVGSAEQGVPTPLDASVFAVKMKAPPRSAAHFSTNMRQLMENCRLFPRSCEKGTSGPFRTFLELYF